MVFLKIRLTSLLLFIFGLFSIIGNSKAQTIKSHKIVTPDTEQHPGFLKNWPYFNF